VLKNGRPNKKMSYVEKPESELKSVRRWLKVLSALLAAILVILIVVFVIPEIPLPAKITEVQVRIECSRPTIAISYSTNDETWGTIKGSVDNFSYTFVRKNLNKSWDISITYHLGTFGDSSSYQPYPCKVIFQIPNGSVVKEETAQSPERFDDYSNAHTVNCTFP